MNLSIVLNLIMVIMTCVGFAMMFTGFGKEGTLSPKGLSSFKYFTVDSNALMGIVALFSLLYELKHIGNGELPYWLVIVKMASTVAVAVTMFTVLFFLAPTSKKGYLSLFTGSSLFFHLLTPLVALAEFVISCGGCGIKFAGILYSLVPVVLYGIVYTVNIFAHVENGHVDKKYDWYGFVGGGIRYAPAAVILMLAGTFLIAACLWFCIR